MRIAAWVFVACALAGAIAGFLPSIELRAEGVALGRRTSLSMFQLERDRAVVRKLIAAYHASGRHKAAEHVADTVLAHDSRHAKRLHFDDARDAMQSLDDVSDDDVRSATTALTVVVWALVAIQAAMALVMFFELQRGAYRRRIYAVLAVSAVVAAVAVGVHVGLGRAIFEVNDDLGHEAMGFGVAAYLLPAAALAAFLACATLCVMRWRRGSA